MVCNNTNYLVDEVIWDIPIQMIGRLVALVYSQNTGNTVNSRRDKKILKNRMEILGGYNAETGTDSNS